MSNPTMQEMDAALHTVLDENDALRAALARVQGRLDALMTAFEQNGSLGILQMIAHDKNLPIETRMKAAGLAVPYERPKLAMTATVQPVKLFDILEEANRRGRVIEPAGKLIEQAPGPDSAA